MIVLSIYFQKSQDSRDLSFSTTAFCPIEHPIFEFYFNNRLIDALNLPNCYKLEMNFDFSDCSFDRGNVFLRKESGLSSNLVTILGYSEVAPFLKLWWIIAFLHAVHEITAVYVEFKS